jgi:glycosyltransferase involved in cell wall biosynthesis
VVTSVVIPTFDKADYLALTLASFTAQTCGDFEVVVADDGSSDHTAQVVASYQDRLRLHLVRQPNRGRAAARNLGVQAATGDLVIFCDDDRIATPGFVAAHQAAHASGARLQVVGAQQAILSIWREDLSIDPQVLWRMLPLPANVLFTPDELTARFDELMARFGVADRWWTEACVPVIARHGRELRGFAAPWMLCSTGNLSMRRSHILELGGFDETFRGWGLEDIDLCYRSHFAGAATHACPEALNHHQLHARPGPQLGQWNENLVRFTEKFATLETALYGEWVSRASALDLLAFNDELLALSGDTAPPALRDELVRVNRVLVRARIAARWPPSGF